MRKGLVLVMALLVFLAACEENGDDGRDVPYIGGTQGLDVSYIDGFPPDRVLDQGEEPFDVIVELTNLGETEVDADDVHVTLSGFSHTSFGYESDDLYRTASEDIEANQRNPDGSIVEALPVEVEFADFAYQEGVASSQEFPFRAEVCYKYSTTAVTDICVQEDMRRGDDDLCDISSVRDIHNSGAPIQVTRLEQSGAGTDTARINMEIENRDSGDVYAHGDMCDSTNRRDNNVYVEIQGLESGYEVDCRGLRDGESDSEGYINLGSEGKTDLTCTIEIDERNTRLQNFDIEVTYDYEESVRKDIVVEQYE